MSEKKNCLENDNKREENRAREMKNGLYHGIQYSVNNFLSSSVLLSSFNQLN